MTGPCNYCGRAGPVRIKEGEDGAAEDLHVCDQCWKLLQSPATALPLIRGDLSISLRGTMSEERLKRTIDSFMERLSSMKPRG
jgi:hypothetical protein